MDAAECRGLTRGWETQSLMMSACGQGPCSWNLAKATNRISRQWDTYRLRGLKKILRDLCGGRNPCDRLDVWNPKFLHQSFLILRSFCGGFAGLWTPGDSCSLTSGPSWLWPYRDCSTRLGAQAPVCKMQSRFLRLLAWRQDSRKILGR